MTAVLLISLSVFLSGSVYSQDHIKSLDEVRTKMTKLGGSLPELIRNAEPRDIRTLERLFEINNYALVTIEAYLKMVKITLSSMTGINKDVLGILNGWLKFISHYCEYDIKYIDEALSETIDAKVVELLRSEKDNISSLRGTSQSGIKENTDLSSTL